MKILTTIFVLACLLFHTASTQQVPSFIPTGGLVAYYGFDGDANDYSGNNNDGIINGASSANDRFGNSNSAYSFNGTTSYIDIPSTILPNIKSSYSISFWCYLNSSADQDFITDRFGSSSFYKYRIFINSQLGNQKFLYGKTGTQIGDGMTLQSSSNILTNQWVFLTAVFDATQDDMRLYVNGSLDANATSPHYNTASNPTQIGRITGPTTEGYADGILDDISFHSVALTNAEVMQIFDGNSVGIDDVAKVREIRISPNPITSKALIYLPSSITSYSFNLYNGTGELIENINGNGNYFYFEKAELGAGIYFLELTSSDGIRTKKIVIQ